MFNARQLQYIAHQAQVIAEGYDEDLLMLDADAFSTAMTAVEILCSLDQRGVLPADWQPDADQRAWLGTVLQISQGVIREFISSGVLESVEVAEDLELCASIQRSMMVTV